MTVFKKQVSEKQIEIRLKTEIAKLNKFFLYWKFKAVCFNGVPDRILILPGPQIYFIELKKPKGGKLSPMQITVHALLKRLGIDVFVIWTFEDLGNFIYKIAL